MAGFEGLEDDVLGRIAASTEEELQAAATLLAVSSEDVVTAQTKGLSGLRRLIKRTLHSEEVAEEEDGGKAKWEGVARVLAVEKGAPEKQIQAEQADSCLEDTGVHVKKKSRSTTAPDDRNPGMLWRKDFKIIGQIGEPGQKDKLSFVSLARQVECV